MHTIATAKNEPSGTEKLSHVHVFLLALWVSPLPTRLLSVSSVVRSG